MRLEARREARQLELPSDCRQNLVFAVLLVCSRTTKVPDRRETEEREERERGLRECYFERSGSCSLLFRSESRVKRRPRMLRGFGFKSLPEAAAHAASG